MLGFPCLQGFLLWIWGSLVFIGMERQRRHILAQQGRGAARAPGLGHGLAPVAVLVNSVRVVLVHQPLVHHEDLGVKCPVGTEGAGAGGQQASACNH